MWDDWRLDRGLTSVWYDRELEDGALQATFVYSPHIKLLLLRIILCCVQHF